MESLMKAGREEIGELARDLKKHWKTISNTARSAKRGAAKGAGKAVKKAKR